MLGMSCTGLSQMQQNHYIDRKKHNEKYRDFVKYGVH